MTLAPILTSSEPIASPHAMVLPYASTGTRSRGESWSQPPVTHYVLEVSGLIFRGREIAEVYLAAPETIASDASLQSLEDELAMWRNAGIRSWMGTETGLGG